MAMSNVRVGHAIPYEKKDLGAQKPQRRRPFVSDPDPSWIALVLKFEDDDESDHKSTELGFKFFFSGMDPFSA